MSCGSRAVPERIEALTNEQVDEEVDMEERERIRRTPSERSSEQETDETVEESTSAAAGDRIKAELDGLLDEIDEVLETNAEDFVKSYVQKGGQ